MEEDTNSILYQRAQNSWIKKSIYTLKLLPKHMKQITKCHALQVHVVVEDAENLDVGWCLCVCVCVCVCVVPLAACGSASLFVREVWLCLWYTWSRDLGTFFWQRDANLTSPFREPERLIIVLRGLRLYSAVDEDSSILRYDAVWISVSVPMFRRSFYLHLQVIQEALYYPEVGGSKRLRKANTDITNSAEYPRQL
jgi:hypothetical protein